MRFTYVDDSIEFYARKIQIFPLLQRWSSVRGYDGSVPTHVVQEDARKGKTVDTKGLNIFADVHRESKKRVPP